TNEELELNNLSKKLGYLLLRGKVTTQLGWAQRLRFGWLLWGQIKDSRVAVASSDLFPTTRCSLVIINTTKISGVAGKLAEILQENNQRVVRVSDEAEILQASKILIDEQADADCLISADLVSWLLPSSIKPAVQAGVSNRYRGDVVLLLG